MTLLALDIGTSHLKAGLFSLNGDALWLAARKNSFDRTWNGVAAYDPQVMWETVKQLLWDAHRWLEDHRGIEPVQSIGVASMAETGMLFDPLTGAARTPLIAWFETCATPQTERFNRLTDPYYIFQRTGLHPTYKYSLMKLLWLKETKPELIAGNIWLSAADWIVFCLAGVLQTDFTLAERTCAFHIGAKNWDSELLEMWHLPVGLFPPVLPSG